MESPEDDDAPEQVELIPDVVRHIALQLLSAGAGGTAMLFTMRRVCKEWHVALSDNSLWERVVREQFPCVLNMLGIHDAGSYFRLYVAVHQWLNNNDNSMWTPPPARACSPGASPG